MDAVKSYNHISPNSRINEIETDIEKEYNGVVVLYKEEGVLRAQLMWPIRDGNSKS